MYGVKSLKNFTQLTKALEKAEKRLGLDNYGKQ